MVVFFPAEDVTKNLSELNVSDQSEAGKIITFSFIVQPAVLDSHVARSHKAIAITTSQCD